MTNTQIVGYIKKSFELKNQGFYKPAIEMLYKALSIDGDNLEILAQLAHIYKLLGNFQRAVDYIEKVLDINDKHLDCLFLLEEIYLLQGNLQLAKDVCEKIYEIQPTSQNLAKKINILNKLNDFNSVQKLEKSAYELNDEVLYEMAVAYYEKNLLPKSLELLELGHAKNTKNDKIMLLLAKIYYDNQNFEKAKEMFSDLEKINPTAEIMNYLGLLKLNESNFTKAVGYFLKATKADAKNSEYLYNLASAYFLNGWLDEALKYFSRAICLNPKNVSYHYSLAYLYYQKKTYDKALFELEFIKTVEPNHDLSNVLNAMVIAKKGDLLTAKNQLEQIVQNNKSEDFAHAALSKIYRELLQLGLAKQSIERAIVSPGCPRCVRAQPSIKREM
ncbi:MAG: tetratricopeptide repeat protein, partial [bacterium]